MPAGRIAQPLTVARGYDYAGQVTIVDPATGNGLDLTGYVAVAPVTALVVSGAGATLGAFVVDATQATGTGVVLVSMPALLTATLTSGYLIIASGTVELAIGKVDAR